MRKICIITSNRADYWLLKPIIHYFYHASNVELQLIVSGAHLSIKDGLSIELIEQDGFPINYRVECLSSTDNYLGLTQAISQGIVGFAKAFAELNPDLLLVLGDRFEIFSAVQSAYCLKIPIAHLHGGELTFGALDDGFRHAISKLSHLHFVSHKDHMDRLIRMGENPNNIILSGAIGIDKMSQFKPIDKDRLSKIINFELNEYFLFTYHPSTLDNVSIQGVIDEFRRLFDEYQNFQILITRSNPDPTGKQLNQFWHEYRDENPHRVCFLDSLGENFHSAIYHSRLVIGNSSSSVIEVPYLGKWAVNIGRRQSGRITSKKCTVHAGHDFSSIKAAIQMVLNRVDPTIEYLYGQPGTVLSRIVSEIGKRSLENIQYKEFYEQ